MFLVGREGNLGRLPIRGVDQPFWHQQQDRKDQNIDHRDRDHAPGEAAESLPLKSHSHPSYASATNSASTAQRRTVQDQSRRWPSQVLRLELVQQLLEGLSSRPAGRHHGVKTDRRLFYRALSSGTINLPLPRFRGRCPVLYDN
jgi:hypothetical protein